MTADRDTFLTAVYWIVDTVYQEELGPLLPVRPGPIPTMSHAEVLTLTVIGQWRGSSQRALLRWAEQEVRDAFPVLLSQSQFNRRLRDLGPLLPRLMTALADRLNQDATLYQILDTTPLPVARRCRGRRQRLFSPDEAALGRGGADRAWYYGCALLLAVAAEGPITGFVLAPADTQDRWLSDALLLWRRDPTGTVPLWTPDDIPRKYRRGGGGYTGPTGSRWFPGSVGRYTRCPYVADTGFRGAAWQPHWQDDAGAMVLTMPKTAPAAAKQQFSGWRQTIETVNGVLIDTLHLRFPQAKTMWGVVTRVAATCAAFNVGVWCNRQLGRDDLAHRTLFAG